jgi:hypothetical protein
MECDDDDAAIRLARQDIDGKAVDILEGVKRMARLDPRLPIAGRVAGVLRNIADRAAQYGGQTQLP